VSSVDVAFFGGSFDPPHVGHVLAAAYALSTAGIEHVLVAPVCVHAFAKPLSSFEDRLAMARLAFEPLSQVGVSELEGELPHPNYTLNTLQEVRRRNPSWRLRLLVGSDVFDQRSKWHQFDKIIELAPPLVLQRAGTPGQQPPSLLPEVSSSEIRALLTNAARAGDHLATLVPKAVLHYIAAHGLYRGAP
jgi:nicotinate-nucleotide adenylyltransferase